MKFFRRTGGYTLLEHKMNEEILEELNIEPGDEQVRRYKSNWLRHLRSMNSNKMTKIMLHCRPNGLRRLEKTLEGNEARLKQDYHGLIGDGR